MLVSGIQHNDVIYVYIAKCSAQCIWLMSITTHSYIFSLVMRSFKIYSGTSLVGQWLRHCAPSAWGLFDPWSRN